MSTILPLEERVAALEAAQRHLEGALLAVRQELRAIGLDVPEPNPDGTTSMSPQARALLQRRRAAKARAAKAIGKGKSAVSSHAATRIRKQLQDLTVKIERGQR